MNRVRIKTMLLAIAFLAISIEAFHRSSYIWDLILFDLTSLLIVGSIIMAIYNSGPRRAFFIGFSLVGGICVLAGMFEYTRSRMITTEGLNYFYQYARQYGFVESSRVFSPTVFKYGSDQDIFRKYYQFYADRVHPPAGSPENFVRIGNSLATIAISFLAGRLSSRYCKIKTFTVIN
jgi:hypothetical protein